MKNYIIVGAAALLLGLGLGSQLFPKIKEKIVEKEVEVIKRDVVTQTKEVVRPDGTREIVTVVVDKSQERKEKESVKIFSAPDWNVALGAAIDSDKKTFYTGHVQRRILGEVFVGVTATTKKEVGLTVGYSF